MTVVDGLEGNSRKAVSVFKVLGGCMFGGWECVKIGPPDWPVFVSEMFKACGSEKETYWSSKWH